MVLITLYKKYFSKKGQSTTKISGQQQPCRHQRDIELVSALGNTTSLAGVHDVPKQGECNTSDNTPSCSICKDEKKAMNAYRLKLVVGLSLPFLTQTLDATMIAGALTFIASDFSRCIIAIIFCRCTDMV